MWILRLVSGLLIFIAFAIADDAANVAPEIDSDATASPDVIPGFDGKVPTTEQLLEMLDAMTGISDEDKEKLKEDLLKNMQGGDPFSEPIVGNDMTMQTVVLLSLLGLVALIFVFFVYKLFKVLSEREVKREEKKKMKQMKKKK